MVSRLLDGVFMNYTAAIPTDCGSEGLLSAKQFASAIDRISLIILEKIRTPVRLEIDVREAVFLLSCATAMGSAADSVPAQIQGDAYIVGFNNRYLLDALRAADTEQVRVRFKGPISPALITPPEGNRFLYMILPVRLREN
jgi:DNA polymerase-3 subunit beta